MLVFLVAMRVKIFIAAVATVRFMAVKTMLHTGMGPSGEKGQLPREWASFTAARVLQGRKGSFTAAWVLQGRKGSFTAPWNMKGEKIALYRWRGRPGDTSQYVDEGEKVFSHRSTC